MNSRSHSYLMSGVLALVALAALLVAYSALPTRLTVAVGPRDGDDYRIFSQLARQLATGRRSVRLSLIPEDGVASAAATLEAGRADLAVVRTDVKVPANGQTVAIMHRNAALLVAPAGAKIKSIADLAGRAIGVVRGTGSNRRMLEVILSHHGLDAASVRIELLDPKDVAQAIFDKRVDIVVAVGHVAGPTLSDVVATVTRVGGGPPVFVDVPEAEAIAKRQPVFESLELLQGSFGGRPPTPAEALTTLANSHRLMARRDLGDAAVAALTKQIFTQRPELVTRVPAASAIEAPESEKDQAFPVHAGALAYLEGEERTFFDRYGDWLYFGIMAVSLLGSVGALAFGSFMRRQANPQRDRLKRVLLILTEARGVETPHELAVLSGELDRLVADALADPVVSDDEARLSALTLAVSSTRGALSERSGELRGR